MPNDDDPRDPNELPDADELREQLITRFLEEDEIRFRQEYAERVVADRQRNNWVVNTPVPTHYVVDRDPGTFTVTGTYYTTNTNHFAAYQPVPVTEGFDGLREAIRDLRKNLAKNSKKKKPHAADTIFKSNLNYYPHEVILEQFRGYTFTYRSKYHSNFKSKKFKVTLVGLCDLPIKESRRVVFHFNTTDHITSMRLEDYGHLSLDLGIRSINQNGNYWLCSLDELECNGCKIPTR